MLAQRDSEAATWRLVVTAGPNAGAATRLGAGRHGIGEAAGNDIVLADPAIAAQHAIIEIVDGQAVLHALAESGVGRHRLKPGARHALRGATEIRLGDSRLALEGPPPPQRRRWAVPLAVLVLLPASLGLALASGRIMPELPGAPARHHTAAPPPRAAAAPEDALAAFRARLEEARLGDSVRLALADGALIAEGEIAPAERARWTAARMWFDAHHGTRLALIERLRAPRPEDLPRLDIRAVAALPVPAIITGAGERYMEGAVLPGGWTIARITPGLVVLRRGEREMHIAL